MYTYNITYKLEPLNKLALVSSMQIEAKNEIDLYKKFARLHPNGYIIHAEVSNEEQKSQRA